MSRERPVLAAVPVHEEARWRLALAARVRPEFRVDRYLPPREHLVLYGPHWSVAGCDRPGNERFVGPARLCERHARLWVDVDGETIDAWLAKAPEIRRRSEASGMLRYDLTSDSPVRRDELRFLLQSLHDGRFTLTFNTKRWNALRAVYRDRESLLDWTSPAIQSPQRSPRGRRGASRYSCCRCAASCSTTSRTGATRSGRASSTPRLTMACAPSCRPQWTSPA